MTHKNAQHFAHGNELDARHQWPRPLAPSSRLTIKLHLNHREMHCNLLLRQLPFFSLSPLSLPLSFSPILPLSFSVACFFYFYSYFGAKWAQMPDIAAGTVGQRQQKDSWTISCEAQNKRQLVCCSHVANGGGRGGGTARWQSWLPCAGLFIKSIMLEWSV